MSSTLVHGLDPSGKQIALAVTADGKLQTDDGGSSGGPQDVNIASDSAGLATSAKQDEILTTLGGLATAANQTSMVDAINNIAPTYLAGVDSLGVVTVDPTDAANYPLAIDMSAHNPEFIELRAPAANTGTVFVTNLPNLAPGTGWPLAASEHHRFYFPVLYLTVAADGVAQDMSYQVVARQ